MEMGIKGLHNVYNALGAIATAHELLKIPLQDIKKYLKNFKGVQDVLNIFIVAKG